MRRSLAVLLSFGTTLITAAHDAHRHLHSRRSAAQAVVTATVTVPVDVYEYDGMSLSEADVCQGIVNGSLQWAANSMAPPDCQSYILSLQSQSSSTTPAPSLSSSAASTSSVSSSSLHVLSASAPATTASGASSISSVSASSSSTLALTSSMSVLSASSTGTIAVTSISASPSIGSSFNPTNSNVDVEFPDGEIDCSVFPSDYGPVEVAWVGHNGWTGVQYANFEDDAVSGLSTGISGNGCADTEDGSTTFCSYACPPGYQKSQWPSTQGNASMAVSVGGLKCENGKLWLTNPSLSSYLCIEGTGKSFVSNELNDNAAICRTDYPGTEDETVPLDTQISTTYPLTCPNSSTYYQHLGAQTSAEYYVNNKGVSVQQACQWGQDGTDEGNWAPVVIGAGTDSSGATWLSIMTSRQNNPTNYQELNFSIELEGDFGGAACFYTQSDSVGYYCSSGSLASFSPDQEGCKSFDPSTGVTVPGCTVQLFSGTATYHLVETS